MEDYLVGRKSKSYQVSSMLNEKVNRHSICLAISALVLLDM